MKLPFAVYTARTGYQWISGLDVGLPLLEQLRRSLGKLPEFDFGDPLSCGVLNEGNWVVVYRFMVEKKGDFVGRDSLYLALTYFQRSIAGSVNVAHLLEMPVFAAAVREPPSSFEYDAGKSSACACDPAVMTDKERARIDFTQAGSAFQYPFAGTMRIKQEVGLKIVVTYSEVVQATLCKQQARVEEGPVLNIQGDDVDGKAPRKKRVRHIGWAAVAAGLLIGAWMLDRDAAKQRCDANLKLSNEAMIPGQDTTPDPLGHIGIHPLNDVKGREDTGYLCYVPAEANAQQSGVQYGKTVRMMQSQLFLINGNLSFCTGEVRWCLGACYDIQTNRVAKQVASSAEEG